MVTSGPSSTSATCCAVSGAGVFLAGAFLAAFLAVFLAGAFFAAFLAVFFAGAFLAVFFVAFLAVFLAGAFFAVGSGSAAGFGTAAGRGDVALGASDDVRRDTRLLIAPAASPALLTAARPT